MCGVLALYDSQPVKNDRLFAEALNNLHHRGPDDVGINLWPLGDQGQIQIGHKRLSIFDLSSHGRQPYNSSCGRWTLSFNGEIYNFRELRQELAAVGENFVSETDTEVLFKLLCREGMSCLSRIRGMYAFVFVDRSKSKLFAARDPWGIKPFYYFEQQNRQLVLASELKIFSMLDIPWQENPSVVAQYLINGEVDRNEETFFSGVKRLPAGHYLEFDIVSKELKTHRWYNLPAPQEYRNYSEWQEKFRELFRRSIELHLRSDVRVGSCLSGGLDSSSIVATMAQQLSSEIHCIHSDFDVPEFSELEYVEQIARAYPSIKLHVVKTDLDDLMDPEKLHKFIWFQDEPVGSTSPYAQYMVMRKAREVGIKVILDGQGADESLAGYVRYLPSAFRELRGRNGTIASVAFARSFLHKGYVPGTRTLMNQYVHSIWQSQPRGDRQHFAPSWQKLLSHQQRSFPTLHEHLVDDLDTGLQHLLRYEDRNSMAFSIEARVPFLDHPLVEHALSARPEWLYQHGLNKAPLRDLGIPAFPQGVLRRTRKMGFVTPEGQWMSKNRNEMISDLSNNFSNIDAYLDSPEKLQRLGNGTLLRLYFYNAWRNVFF